MRRPVHLVFVLLANLLSHSVHAADIAVVTVNGQFVKQTWMDAVRQDIQESGRRPDDQAILSLLLKNELLAQEAIRIGIDKRPEFTAREEVRRRELLATLAINDSLKNNPISEDMLKAEYANFKTAVGDKEYSARHIQVQTETEARDVIAQLAKGADFAKLAKEKSIDPSTRDGGGTIGWFTRNAIAPSLAEAAVKLQKGLFTTVPVQTSAGWHVLKLEDVRDFQPPAYEKIKEQLRNRLKNKQVAKLVESLRTKAKIDVGK